jgi:hypothetical protein
MALLWKKILIGLSTLFLLVIGAVTLFVSRLPDLCANTVLIEYPSPSGQLKAVIFDRDCGATTDFSTQVSMLPASSSLENEGGNIFSADTDHRQAPSWKNGGPEVRFRWVSDKSAVLQYHQFARVVRANSNAKGVQVAYSTFQ